VPQRVRGHRLVDAGLVTRTPKRAGQLRIIQMVAPHHAVQRIAGTLHRCENELPAELAGGAHVFARQRMWQSSLAAAIRKVKAVQHPRPLDLGLQAGHQAVRKHGAPILAALSLCGR
jgi:hypothetical protein